MLWSRSTAVALLGLLVLIGLGRPARAQGIHYVYDRLGRLTGVVDQSGNAATYQYDRAGNITAIQRSDAGPISGPIGITLVSPGSGRAGTAVSIFGKGFSATPSENQVSFGGVPATVTSAEANALTATVPAGAVTGPISVTSPSGSAASPTPFTVQ